MVAEIFITVAAASAAATAATAARPGEARPSTCALFTDNTFYLQCMFAQPTTTDVASGLGA